MLRLFVLAIATLVLVLAQDQSPSIQAEQQWQAQEHADQQRRDLIRQQQERERFAQDQSRAIQTQQQEAQERAEQQRREHERETQARSAQDQSLAIQAQQMRDAEQRGEQQRRQLIRQDREREAQAREELELAARRRAEAEAEQQRQNQSSEILRPQLAQQSDSVPATTQSTADLANAEPVNSWNFARRLVGIALMAISAFSLLRILILSRSKPT